MDPVARGLAASAKASLPYESLQFIHNFKRSNYLKSRAALGKVLAKQGQARVGFFGDSTSAGVGAGGNASTPLKANSPVSHAQRLLNANIPTSGASFMGRAATSGFDNATYVGYNPTVSLSANWVLGTQSLGGLTFLNQTDALPLSWAPTEQWDTVDIYCFKTTAGSTVAFDIDGGTPITPVINLFSSVPSKVTMTSTLGAHTLNLKRTAGGLHIIGVVAYNSTAPAVSMVNLGRSSALSTDFSDVGTTYAIGNMIDDFAADLGFINLGINDWIGATTQAAYETAIQYVITQIRLTGDAVLVMPTPTAVAAVPQSRQDIFYASVQKLAIQNDIAWIDLRTAIGGSWEVANALGLYVDNNHPTGAGYAIPGSLYARFIQNL